MAKELEIPDALQRVIPAHVRKVSQYFGSFVRINLEHGDHTAFEARIYLTDWTFFDGKEAIAGSSGPAESNNVLLDRLVGARLLSMIGKDAELWLLFSDAMSLKLTANLDEYEIGDELLVVSLDDAYVKFSPARGFTLAPAIRSEH